jgi:hypothetical protein
MMISLVWVEIVDCFDASGFGANEYGPHITNRRNAANDKLVLPRRPDDFKHDDFLS